ncbi:hypothetical protein PR048_014134 [Dryococelus australis]|uniref:Uncharacterized protein n=1 Tax=Dryococelus australis TaxID=614101 RepID=A0ABQ9HDB6_9NEOP|nr:hypothetical protein PR048_014134 [Dryococelus australis]
MKQMEQKDQMEKMEGFVRIGEDRGGLVKIGEDWGIGLLEIEEDCDCGGGFLNIGEAIFVISLATEINRPVRANKPRCRGTDSLDAVVLEGLSLRLLVSPLHRAVPLKIGGGGQVGISRRAPPEIVFYGDGSFPHVWRKRSEEWRWSRKVARKPRDIHPPPSPPSLILVTAAITSRREPSEKRKTERRSRHAVVAVLSCAHISRKCHKGLVVSVLLPTNVLVSPGDRRVFVAKLVDRGPANTGFTNRRVDGVNSCGRERDVTLFFGRGEFGFTRAAHFTQAETRRPAHATRRGIMHTCSGWGRTFTRQNHRSGRVMRRATGIAERRMEGARVCEAELVASSSHQTALGRARSAARISSRLERSSPTKAVQIRLQSASNLKFSHVGIVLIGGFSRGTPVSSSIKFQCCFMMEGNSGSKACSQSLPGTTEAKHDTAQGNDVEAGVNKRRMEESGCEQEDDGNVKGGADNNVYTGDKGGQKSKYKNKYAEDKLLDEAYRRHRESYAGGPARGTTAERTISPWSEIDARCDRRGESLPVDDYDTWEIILPTGRLRAREESGQTEALYRVTTAERTISLWSEIDARCDSRGESLPVDDYDTWEIILPTGRLRAREESGQTEALPEGRLPRGPSVHDYDTWEIILPTGRLRARKESGQTEALHRVTTAERTISPWSEIDARCDSRGESLPVDDYDTWEIILPTGGLRAREESGQTEGLLSSLRAKGRGKREISEITRRPTASFGTIPVCKNPGVTLMGFEPGSPWWEVSRLTALPPLLK